MKQRELKQAEVANFFATLLMKFPLISSISYKASSRLVCFTFLVKSNQQPVKSSFSERWMESCCTLHHLRGVEPQHIDIKTVAVGDLVSFTYIRDLETLSFIELTLSARLLADEFRDNLVVEQLNGKYVSSAREQQILAKMLDLAKQQVIDKDLHVFRDDDRVIVADI